MLETGATGRGDAETVRAGGDLAAALGLRAGGRHRLVSGFRQRDVAGRRNRDVGAVGVGNARPLFMCSGAATEQHRGKEKATFSHVPISRKQPAKSNADRPCRQIVTCLSQ